MQGLYNASSSMLVNQARLESTSNNLSNINTPGYKRSEAVQLTFPETLTYRLEQHPGLRGRTFASPVGTTADNVAVEETHVFHETGSLRPTGRSLDMAVEESSGFFALDTPEGMRFTRDGSFFLSVDEEDEATLVNPQGFPVLGEEGEITLDNRDIEVDQEGNIYQEGEYVDTLEVYDFEDEGLLWKEGYNLFEAEEGAEPGLLDDPGIAQGYLEESNSDLSRQMKDLIKVSRSYESAQRISQSYDRMLSQAANELGTLA